MATITGKGTNGSTYNIGSEKGQNFVNNAAVGATMTGGDGSTWTKNSDGTTTISKGGSTWTVANQGGGASTGGGSSYTGRGSGTPTYANTGYGTYNSNPSYDYSNALRELLNTGSTDYDTLENLINERTAKALSTEGLGQYANDSFAQSVRDYIASGRNTQSKQSAGADALVQQYMDLYNSQQSEYAQRLAAEEAAKRAAVEQAVNRLTGQKEDTNTAYSNMYRQAYIDNMNARKNLNQRLAAQGITGGAAESTLLGLSTSYADALRQGEQNRIGALSDIDQAISDARLTGDIDIANARADTIREQTNSYANVLQNLIDRYDTLAAQQSANDRADAQAAQASARQIALSMINNGVMPDDETLSAAGMTSSQAEGLLPTTAAGDGDVYSQLAAGGATDYGTAYAMLLANGYRSTDAQRLATYYAENYAQSRRQTVNNPTTQRTSYNNGGLSSEQVRALQAALGVMQDGYFGPASQAAAQAVFGTSDPDAAYRAATGRNETDTPTGTTAAGMNESIFNQEARVIMSYLGQGMVDQAQNRLARIWNSLSADQQQVLTNALTNNGYTS